MKKILSVILCAFLLLSLFGCAGLATLVPERGVIEDNVYKSESLGITFTKPDRWSYYSDEQIAELHDIAVDELATEKFAEALENSDAIYDMMAIDSNNGTNISVGYENLLRTLSVSITAEDYIETLKEQMSEVTGIETEFSDEITTQKLGEVEFAKIVCTSSINGEKLTQVFYARKVGAFMGYIVLTIPKGYTVEYIEGLFS